MPRIHVTDGQTDGRLTIAITRMRVEEIKIGINVPQGTSKWSARYQLKWSKVKVTERAKHQKLPHIWHTSLLTGAGGSGADCKLGLTIVRPNFLSTPETLGNWTDGRITCRHSAPTSFLVLSTFELPLYS